MVNARAVSFFWKESSEHSVRIEVGDEWAAASDTTVSSIKAKWLNGGNDPLPGAIVYTLSDGRTIGARVSHLMSITELQEEDF
jgi:hypothetical protein